MSFDEVSRTEVSIHQKISPFSFEGGGESFQPSSYKRLRRRGGGRSMATSNFVYFVFFLSVNLVTFGKITEILAPKHIQKNAFTTHIQESIKHNFFVSSPPRNCCFMDSPSHALPSCAFSTHSWLPPIQSPLPGDEPLPSDQLFPFRSTIYGNCEINMIDRRV